MIARIVKKTAKQGKTGDVAILLAGSTQWAQSRTTDRKNKSPFGAATPAARLPAPFRWRPPRAHRTGGAPSAPRQPRRSGPSHGGAQWSAAWTRPAGWGRVARRGVLWGEGLGTGAGVCVVIHGSLNVVKALVTSWED